MHVLIAMPAFPKKSEEFTPTLIWVKEDLRNQIVRFYLPPTVLVCFGPTWKHLGRGKRKVLDQFWLVVILHILTMIPRVSPFPLYQRFLNFRITLKPNSRSFESGFFIPTRKEQSRKLKKMMTLRSLTSNVSSVVANIVHASVIRNCLSVHFLITRCLWETSPVEFFSYFYSAYFLQRFADNVQTNI